MAETHASRRTFIEMAAVMVPVAALAGCTGGNGGSIIGQISQAVGIEPLAAAPSEQSIWQGAIGSSSRLGTSSGPVFATLGSVTAQPSGGERPDELRQQPLLLSFTIDAGYDPQVDDMFYLDRTMGTESRLFMQRGTDASGRPELVALLN
jgi:hypothetical protein